MKHVAQYQRGNIALMALVCFTLVAFCVVLALDVGRLYLERRNLQRVADMVALEIAASEHLYNTDITASDLQALAWEAAERNGLANSAENVIDVEIVAKGNSLNAASIDISRTVPGSIVPNMAAILPGVAVEPTITIRAQAMAQRQLLAAIQAGTNLLSISTDSTSSPLLGSLLNQMLGTSVDLNAVSYQGLAEASISLMDIATSLGLSVMSAEALLDSQVRVIDLIDASITKLEKEGLAVDVEALTYLRARASNVLGSQYFRLSDILEINNELLTKNDAVNALVNVGDLLSAGIYAANKTVTVSIPKQGAPALAEVGGNLTLKVTEPPRIAVGPPGCPDGLSPPCNGQWLTEIKPAQLELSVPLTTRLLGGLLKLDLNLNVKTAQGRASLESVERLPDGTYEVVVGGAAVPVTVGVSTNLELLSLDAVGLGSLVGVGIDGGNNISRTLQNGGEKLTLVWPGSDSAQTLSGGGVASVLGVLGEALTEENLNVTVDLPAVKNIPILGGLLGAVVDLTIQPLINSLLGILGGLGGALTYLLDDVLDPLLTPVLAALGVETNTMDVRVLGVNAGSVELVM